MGHPSAVPKKIVPASIEVRKRVAFLAEDAGAQCGVTETHHPSKKKKALRYVVRRRTGCITVHMNTS
jgi:hypothetical protein